jgi:AcrR family transcriptional regulator
MSKAIKSGSRVRSYAGQSAEERRDERREKFLQAGLQVFGSLGYRSGTVRVLCKQAGLTDRYFYESFTDTEALLKAVYEQEMAKVQQSLVEAMPGLPNDWQFRVRAVLNLYFGAMRNPLAARITLIEILGVSSRINAAYNASTLRFGSLIIAFMRAALPKLEIDADLEKTLGIAIAGACAMSAAQWMLEGYKSTQDSVVDACAMVALGALQQLASLQPKP